MDDRMSQPFDAQAPPPIRRHKIRRTFGSVRKDIPARHFTDPIVRLNKDEAYGSIVPSAAFSNLSPMSNVSTFEVDLPHGTPVFTSSPPSYGPPQNRFTITKRISVAPSDPTTASSDNDTRVFTDDDSMDFQSDTAYDSLATRATASSHSGFRQPKIETIFDESSVHQPAAESSALEDLMQRATLDDARSIRRESSYGQSASIGIGISGLEEANGEIQNLSPDQATTPVKSPIVDVDDFVLTPVPKRQYRQAIVLSSSPSTQLFPPPRDVEPELPPMMDVDDEDDIDWSPKSANDTNRTTVMEMPSSPIQTRFEQLSEDDFDEQQSTKKSSIFDWSEYSKFGSDQSNGISPRPQTVHGKQGSHVGRSRPSGRKGNAAMHLRSQSVPVVNRDSVAETDTPSSATKFGTWALGSKPVSEEWSDDFEFDDGDVVEEAPGTAEESKATNRESIRSVKVPQSIMDRQQSVHVQFGQVRDFMLLVEELKRLRLRGATLGLLESHSRQLWEDAGSIIDLATVNEDDDALPRAPSPVSSDIFGDETPPPKRTFEEEEGRIASRRSISSPATPPHGRPRGESVQAKNFLQAIHQNRREVETSPAAGSLRGRGRDRDKLPFDTQDLRDLVVRAGVITRALKEIVRKAEGVSLSPERPAQKFQEPVFRQIFEPPNSSPSPESRKPGLPKSRSANSYLDTLDASGDCEIQQPLKFTTVVEAN
ncbi:hypothetical protein AYL99_10869 [Fonsecaea erecta]|uniref:Uncharacterized protein n=1 Tax=Fonsecaea erecta TaxID=1367422 RepID=A0A178Z5X7_9EURO|nr:hypothetical protein AYL99_10869 [Fonsecaea erecta]OAP55169.1 hypothetical protein AYL99_10869 [Fonsecaea erecta]